MSTSRKASRGVTTRQGPQPAKMQREQSRNVAVEVRQEFNGPIPPPEILAQYDNIMPGLGQKIIDQFLSETAHRHDVESRTVEINKSIAESSMLERKHGQRYGFATFILMLLAIVYLAMNGHDNVAMVLGGTTMAAVIGLFLVRRQETKAKK